MTENADILKRASQETELYVDLVTNLVLAMLNGQGTVGTASMKGIVEGAITGANLITNVGIGVFEERVGFWVSEAEKQVGDKDDPKWKQNISKAKEVADVLNKGKTRPKPKHDLAPKVQEMIAKQVERHKKQETKDA